MKIVSEGSINKKYCLLTGVHGFEFFISYEPPHFPFRTNALKEIEWFQKIFTPYPKEGIECVHVMS